MDKMRVDLINFRPRLFSKPKFLDVRLNVLGTMLPAHRRILKIRCPYLAKLLHGRQETEIQERVSDFLILMEFVYTGKLNVTNHQSLMDLVDLYGLAERFEMKKMKHQIDVLLVEKMKTDLINVNLYITNAFMYEMACLKKASLRYIEKAIDGRNQSIDFTNEMLLELTRCPMRTVSEVKLFQEILQVFHYYSDLEKKEILENIRFSIMTPWDLAGIVHTSNLLDSDTILRLLKNCNGVEKLVNFDLEYTTTDHHFLWRTLETIFTYFFTLFSFSKQEEIDLEHYKWFGNNDLVMALKKPSVFNKLDFWLMEGVRGMYFTYYIEVSRNGIDWFRIIDYTECKCRGRQVLRFQEVLAKFVKIVGTSHHGPRRLKFISDDTRIYLDTK